ETGGWGWGGGGVWGGGRAGPDDSEIRRFPGEPGPEGEQQRRTQRPCGVRHEIPQPAMSPPRHALGDLDEGSHQQRREQSPDEACLGPPELDPRHPVEAGEQGDVCVVLQGEHEHVHRGDELVALRCVDAEVGLRGKGEETEHHERQIGPGLAAQGDKGEEGENARTDANREKRHPRLRYFYYDFFTSAHRPYTVPARGFVGCTTNPILPQLRSRVSFRRVLGTRLTTTSCLYEAT